MALTVKKVFGKDASANLQHPSQYIQLYEIAFDSSYPTGGEAFDPDGAVAVWHLYGGTYIYRWDSVNKKILAYKADDRIDTAADGRLIEETNATNLSAQTGLIFAVLVDKK